MWRDIDRLDEGEVPPPLPDMAAGAPAWLGTAKLKLVDGCNLRCFMCSYWERRREGELALHEVVRVLDELAGLGCQKVHLTGGELFLRPDIPAIVAHATGLGMRVNLTTNGTRLDKGTLKELLSIPVRGITTSLDGPTRGVHDTIRGRKGAFDKTLRTLDRVLARRGPKTRVRVNTVVSKQNLDGLAAMGLLLRDRGLDGWLLLPLDAPAAHPAHLRESDIATYNRRTAPMLAETVHIAGFDPWIFGRDTRFGAHQQWARGLYARQPCYAPWFHVLVGPSGDVYTCCNLHRRVEPLGNVRVEGLAAIWHGERARAFRAAMWRERLPQCHACPDFARENEALHLRLQPPRAAM